MFPVTERIQNHCPKLLFLLLMTFQNKSLSSVVSSLPSGITNLPLAVKIKLTRPLPALSQCPQAALRLTKISAWGWDASEANLKKTAHQSPNLCTSLQSPKVIRSGERVIIQHSSAASHPRGGRQLRGHLDFL